MSGCPFHTDRILPTDGTPLVPSPTLAKWREEGSATPLIYPDGHEGLIVTRHQMAREVLADPRFTLTARRFPHPPGIDERVDADEAAILAMDLTDLLRLDGEQHLRIRKALLPHFSVKAVQRRAEEVRWIVSEELQRFLALPQPADIYHEYATPVSMRTHALFLGITGEFVGRYNDLFVLGHGSVQERFDMIRDWIDSRKMHPSDDLITHLLGAELSREEIEGALFAVMSAGRDSVAYMITTSVVALLTNPDQLQLLRHRLELMPNAVEELIRMSSMFLTLFPRTAVEDLELEDREISTGTTLAVSPVAANRDPRAFPDPDRLDVERDAFGHLSFSYGPHGCIGQQLARVEIREALSQLLEAVPDLRLIDATQLQPLPFAHPVATYEAGSVLVVWRPDTEGADLETGALV